MVQVLVIDALNLIRRIEAACRPSLPQSVSTNGPGDMEKVGQLCQQAMKKLLKGHQPSHAIAVFDGTGHGWRKSLFEGYKEGRSEMPEALRQYLDQIQQQWLGLGVDSLIGEDEEADDLIASLARKVVSHQGQITIVSTDTGFCQLLPQGVRQWDHFNGQWLDESYVQQKFKINSRQLLDYWAMAGHSGNKIPGVPGIGPKTACTILNQHDSLKVAFGTEASDRALKKLHSHRSEAQLSYRLCRLKSDIPLGFNLQDIRYRP